MKDDDNVRLSVRHNCRDHEELNSKKTQHKGDKLYTGQGVSTPRAGLPRSMSLGELLYMLSLLVGTAFLWYLLNGTGMQVTSPLIGLLVIALLILAAIVESYALAKMILVHHNRRFKKSDTPRGVSEPAMPTHHNLRNTPRGGLVRLTLKTVNILACIAIFTFSKEFRGQFSKELVNIILKDVMNTIETHGYWAGVYKAIKSIFWMTVDGIKEQQHDPDSEEQPSADRS